MNSIFIPSEVFIALENNPKLSIKELKELANVAYSTAARYKNNYNKYCIKLINVHHIKNKVNIGDYSNVNKQYAKLKIFLDYLLNNEGFDSSGNLRDSFYKEHPEFEKQKNRNFNRYFSKYRDSIDPANYKLEIYKSSEKLIGFCTRPNLNFKPTDN